MAMKLAGRFAAFMKLAVVSIASAISIGEGPLRGDERAPAFTTASADRTTMLFPVDSAPTVDESIVDGPSLHFPDQALRGHSDPGWQAYLRVWKAHHHTPDDVETRRFLGLSLNRSSGLSSKRGRSAPSWLTWRAGSYDEIDTPHFIIYSQADAAYAAEIAADLERCYWTWTQMFFPLWEAHSQVSAALDGLKPDQTIAEFLQEHRGRITIRRKLKIVLFRDSNQYSYSLSGDVPGIERSTGFYSDARKTMCLYASENDDAATRRHELVHQLFREATRSELGRGMPGEQSGFWLVEGIAGYFESMNITSDLATVGGWDSPRLQFARYRILVGGDFMSLDELSTDGRVAAQQREDLARWYAHAITHTHRLMDGGVARDRLWVYRELAKLYRIAVELPETDSQPSDTQQGMRDFLAVDDQHVIANPSTRTLESLCLAGCPITETGLTSIGARPELTWLDLSRLPVGNDAFQSLLPSPSKLEQLSAEATKIDSGIDSWLTKAARLRELDLSWTIVDDRVIGAVGSAKQLEVLWMTGTRITDASIDAITGMNELASVDVQRSLVTQAGIERLREASSAEINPLELRTSP